MPGFVIGFGSFPPFLEQRISSANFPMSGNACTRFIHCCTFHRINLFSYYIYVYCYCQFSLVLEPHTVQITESEIQAKVLRQCCSRSKLVVVEERKKKLLRIILSTLKSHTSMRIKWESPNSYAGQYWSTIKFHFNIAHINFN